MSKRTITIVIEFEQEKPPNWIWDSHRMNMPCYGIDIKSIAEGDLIKTWNDKMEQ